MRWINFRFGQLVMDSNTGDNIRQNWETRNSSNKKKAKTKELNCPKVFLTIQKHFCISGNSGKETPTQKIKRERQRPLLPLVK